MQLFLDVDGIVLDFRRALYSKAKEVLKLVIPNNYEHDHYFLWKGKNPLMTLKEWNSLLGVIYTDGTLQNLPLQHPDIPGMLIGAKALGCEVVLLSSLPTQAWPDRELNIIQSKVFHHVRHCTDPRVPLYLMVNHLHKGEEAIYIGDQAEVCSLIVKKCDVHVILLNRRYNASTRLHSKVERIHEWGELFSRISRLDRGED